ncbi:MAG: response regulator [Ignavibacteriaceae bacterium]
MKKNIVLIVEDEKDTLFILDKLLTKNDFQVYTSTNGQEALKLLDEILPQVIIADWTMPVMSGLELCNLIKKNEKFKSIYFIILTARASLKDRVTGLDLGADDFLVKPVQNQELLARIRSGIRIYNLQNELIKIEHNKALIEMACTIGHKINNPLSSLVVSIHNIEQEIKKFENTQKKSFAEDFNVISQSIERIKILVNDLTHLQNPEIIDYTSDNKMLKLD